MARQVLAGNETSSSGGDGTLDATAKKREKEEEGREEGMKQTLHKRLETKEEAGEATHNRQTKQWMTDNKCIIQLSMDLQGRQRHP